MVGWRGVRVHGVCACVRACARACVRDVMCVRVRPQTLTAFLFVEESYRLPVCNPRMHPLLGLLDRTQPGRPYCHTSALQACPAVQNSAMLANDI